MPSSRVPLSASCNGMPVVETVSRPSYTLTCCRGHPEGCSLPGAGCSSFHQHAAIRYWHGHCLPLFDGAPACSAPFQQHR